MAAKKRRSSASRSRRPSSESTSSTPAVKHELPPVANLGGDSGSTEDAIAALDVAERAAAVDAPAGDTQTDITAASPAAPVGGVNRIEALEAQRTARTNGNGVHAPPPAKPKDRSITGKQYSGLDRKQLRTALAIAENRNVELERQVRDVVPVAAAANVVALEKMVAVVTSAAFDITALVTSLEEVRLDRDEERELGELGAPAIAPYIGEWIEYAPLAAFGAKLATVITTKVIVVKHIRAAAAKRRAESSDGR